MMKIELRPIAAVRPYEKNPRVNDGAVDAVARSIQQFGFRQPIVIDEDNTIIVGHTRWKAAQKLGMDKVPVHVARGLSPEQVRAYRVADNKTNELASWDLNLLPFELSELNGLGFDLLQLGFSADELASLRDPGQSPESTCFPQLGRVVVKVSAPRLPGKEAFEERQESHARPDQRQVA